MYVRSTDDRHLHCGDVRLMYSNVFAFDHVRWSEERFYMALLMGGAMALVMFAFMRST